MWKTFEVTIEFLIVKRKNFENLFCFSSLKVSPNFRHYPQPKPTVVVDNREMQRIRQVNDIQSNVNKQEEFVLFYFLIEIFFFSRRNITKISIKVKVNLRLLPMIRALFELKNNNELLVKRNTLVNEKNRIQRYQHRHYQQ